MSRPPEGPSRPLVVAALFGLVLLVIGSAGAAYADPGSGNGQGQETASANVATADDSSPGKSEESQGNKHEAAAAAAAPTAAASSSSNADHSQGNASTEGEYDEPQPPSKADRNEHGANGGCDDPGDDGPYCSTRDGSPSENGNGGGKAVGKPCAGCVGKADNKNPKGQLPGPQDRNNGYECDGNKGIAKGNPAHTGCEAAVPPPTTPPPTTPPPTTPPPTTPPPTTPPPTTPPPTPPVTAPTPPDEVGGVEDEAPRPPAVVPQPPSAGILPAAGATSLVGLAGAGGLLLVGAGVVSLLMQRRTRDS